MNTAQVDKLRSKLNAPSQIESVSLSHIYQAAKRLIFRTINSVDRASSAAERAVIVLDEKSETWAIKALAENEDILKKL